MFKPIAQHGLTGVNRCMVTNQNKALRQMPSDMFQGGDHILTIHTAVKMTFVDFARPRQADRRRQDAALTRDPVDNRSLPPGGPSSPQPFQKGRAKFIEKHDVDATSLRLFLSEASPAPATLG